MCRTLDESGCCSSLCFHGLDPGFISAIISSEPPKLFFHPLDTVLQKLRPALNPAQLIFVDHRLHLDYRHARR